MTIDNFITTIFQVSEPSEAYDLCVQHPELQQLLTLTTCVECLFHDEIVHNTWRQTDIFIAQNNNQIKIILRDLLDTQMIQLCEENLMAEEVFDITFFLLEKGLLCIAAEYFAAACDCVPNMQQYWDTLKNDFSPNLRSYLIKFADQDVNLEFMKGLLKTNE